MLIELLYRSRATRPMTQDDLNQILSAARKNNPELGITGVLLYSEQTKEFVQLLEGEERFVYELVSRIQVDPRHDDIEIVYDGVIQQPRFGHWSMAFRRVDGLHPDELVGCLTFDSEKFASVFSRRETSTAGRFLSQLCKNL